jgi:hypothetical protein
MREYSNQANFDTLRQCTVEEHRISVDISRLVQDEVSVEKQDDDIMGVYLGRMNKPCDVWFAGTLKSNQLYAPPTKIVEDRTNRSECVSPGSTFQGPGYSI